MTGIAVQQWTAGEGFRAIELPEPELGEDGILVDVDLATVCGSDLHTVSGRRSSPSPGILGHEGVGRIRRLAARRFDLRGRELAVGDRVVWSVTASCGQCDRCAAGRSAKCRRLAKVGHEPLDGPWPLSGCYAASILLPGGIAIASVPDAVPDSVAAPAGCAAATVLAAAEAAGELAGRRVLISGSGMLGVVAAALARDRGAAAVEVRDVSAERLALAARFGATVTTLLSAAEPTGPPLTADIAFELSGQPSGVAGCLASLDIGGRLVLVGSVSPGPAVPLDPEAVVRGQLGILGVHNYEPRHLQQALDFLERSAERYDWASLVAEPLPLARLGEAMQPPRGGLLRTAVSPR